MVSWRVTQLTSWTAISQSVTLPPPIASLHTMSMYRRQSHPCFPGRRSSSMLMMVSPAPGERRPSELTLVGALSVTHQAQKISASWSCVCVWDGVRWNLFFANSTTISGRLARVFGFNTSSVNANVIKLNMTYWGFETVPLLEQEPMAEKLHPSLSIRQLNKLGIPFAEPSRSLVDLNTRRGLRRCRARWRQ